MISKWNYLPFTSEDREIARQLEPQYPSCPAIARLLVQRGMRTREQVRDFLSPSLSQLHDPFLMRDMSKAVNRLNKALGAKEKIMVYGDYDVDGSTAVAVVYRYLQNFYSNLCYYVPTRDDEGYGISLRSVDYAASIGVKLIIVLDCGVKAVEEIAYAKSKGIDFIVCDHHVPDDVLPDAVAILNPKLKDDPYPFKGLSGCGVGFKFMQGFAKSNGIDSIYNLESQLDLVAVSIAADIVPIVGENRILATYGLKRLNSNPNVGFRSIIKLCGLTNREITMSDIIFKIGPRINASGRMESGMEAVELLVTKDPQEAREISHRIDQYNRERKLLDHQITDEANQIIENHKNDIVGKKPIVLYDRNWHKGIIGIVAARLSELYFRPSVVLTYDDNGIAVGSSRSVRGFDVYSAINSCRDLLENFGGHTNAVGLSIREDNISEFRNRLTAYVEEHISDDQITPQIDVDAEIEFDEINSEMLKYLRMFNPYGPDNTKPVFVTCNVVDSGTSKLVGRKQEHIKLDITPVKGGRVMSGIAFGKAQYFDAIKQGKPFDICYTIEENKRRSSNSAQLLIKSIRLHEDGTTQDGGTENPA